MSIYYTKPLPINEVEVTRDGQKIDLDEEDENKENPATDYGSEEDNITDTTNEEPTDDTPSEEEDTGTDYTIPDDEESTDVESDTDNTDDTSSSEETPEDDASTDYTLSEDDDQQTDNPEGNEDTGTDYTSGGDDEGSDSGSTEEQDPNQPTDDTSQDDEITNNIEKLEKELFSDLTPQEFSIKDKELKDKYLKLYDVLDSIIDRINSISKTEQNNSILAFAAEKTTELKQIALDYLVNVYGTKTYIDNAIVFNQYLAVLSGINKILKQIPIEQEEK